MFYFGDLETELKHTEGDQAAGVDNKKLFKP